MVRKRTAGNVLQRVGRALSNEQPGRRSRSRSAPRARRGRSGGAKSKGKGLLRRLLR